MSEVLLSEVPSNEENGCMVRLLASVSICPYFYGCDVFSSGGISGSVCQFRSAAVAGPKGAGTVSGNLWRGCALGAGAAD